MDAALSGIHDRLGPVTVLVNAAGLDGFKRFNHITFEDWQRVIDVNLNGVFHTIQAVLPDMVEAGWGRIVNISSSSTHSGAPYMAHYVAAKSAVNGLTKSLALEYGPERHHRQRGTAGLHRHPDAAQRGGTQGFLGDIEQNIARRRCAGWASPKTSRRHAHFWCPRKPATSPVRSWASTAAATPEHHFGGHHVDHRAEAD